MSKILCILDGFGLAPESENNCNARAKMPNLRRIMTKYGVGSLDADGEAVGQEAGLVGNSEVGHMNIGGLKLCPQLSFQITKSSENNFAINKELAPDQNINPRGILINNFNIKLKDLINVDDEICQLIYQSWQEFCENELGTGEVIDGNLGLTVRNYLYHIGSWYAFSDLNHQVLLGLAKIYTNQGFDKIARCFEQISAKNEDELIAYLESTVGKKSKIVHLAGLFSTGCIHSDLRHWAGAIRCSVDAGVEKVILHFFSDGRDSDKKSLVQTWKDFAKQFEGTEFEDKIYLGSLGGRFFAMDRDKNFDRVEYGAFAMLDLSFETQEQKEVRLKTGNYICNYNTRFSLDKKSTNLEIITSTLEDLTNDNYAKNKFDENIQPTSIKSIKNQEELIGNLQIQKNETLWFVNFRSDRMKQLGKFVVELNTKYELNLNILGMSDYGIGGGYEPIFTSKPVQNTLAETISKINKIDKIVLMHCRGGENSRYFYEGIESWCKNKNIEYIAPKIVGNDAPAKDWLDELSKIEITKNTVLIGHSMGCIALCKYLSDNNLAFNSLHLVSGWQYNINSPSQNALAQGNTFEPETIDYQKIANNGNVVLHCSKDDAPNRLENTQKYEQAFNVLANWYQNYAHFNQDNVNFVELEERLETANQTTQLHLAETEKYAHVTFFFNGGVEAKSSGEDWMVIPSNKVNSHAEIPEMKAMEITDYILENNAKYDYIMVNYANPDMVGHTGDIPASIRSMEFLDTQLGRLFEAVEKDGHSMVIIADHGNVEFVGEYIKGDKELTDTEHNANPVPCIVVGGKNPAQIIKRDFSQEWLTAEEVETLRKTALPLWKTGEILINL